MSGLRLPPPPREPIDLSDVAALYPAVRQSVLAKFDDCALSTLFELKYGQGWNTHPAGRGILFHRAAAEMLRTMRAVGSQTIPVGEALAILAEVVRQRDVPPEEIVRVPLREVKELRMAVIKFASDNAFSIEKIVDIERRFDALIEYDGDDGASVRRRFSGQLDVLLFEPPDEAIVIDWKATFGLPPEPRDVDGPADELKGISYHGYFQQRAYALLVFRNFPAVQRVTLREFYPYFTEVRKASISRAQLPEIEDEFAVLAEAFDRAVASGQPKWPYRADAMGRWAPSPGRHCGFCLGKRLCPIEAEARGDGAITSEVVAHRYAAELQVTEELRAHLRGALKAWVETAGRPVRVRWSKGRRALGWYRTKRGRRFGFYTPDASDRGTHVSDAELEAAMRDAAVRARSTRRAGG